MANVGTPAYYPSQKYTAMTPVPAPGPAPAWGPAPGPGPGPAWGPAPGPAPASGPAPGPAPAPGLTPASATGPGPAWGPAGQVYWYQVFLKLEPKALGTVQIMIGVMTFLFGIVISALCSSFICPTGSTIWAAAIYIGAGALTVAAANHNNSCLMKALLIMNAISAVAAGVSLILLSIDVGVGPQAVSYSYHNDYMRAIISYLFDSQSRGISGVLLVFCLLQCFLSIYISAFVFKATYFTQPRGAYFVPNTYTTNAVMQCPPSAPAPYHQTVVV